KPASKVERTAPIERSEDVRGRADVNQKDRGERRRRKSKGKNRDNRRPSGRRPDSRPVQQQAAPKVRHATGFIMQTDAPKYLVMSENKLLTCTADGSVTKNGALHVGDRVRVIPGPKQDGRIDKYEPRQNYVSCPSRSGEQILAANVNQVFLVVSVKEPMLRNDWLDRHLIICERRGFKPVICCSKIDLAEDNAYLEQMEYYRRMGYRVIYVSAVLPTSLQDLRNMLKGKTTVLTGHAGVGKTTIVELLSENEKAKQRLQTEEDDREPSEDYTPTKYVECRRLESGGYVVDTPGITEYEFSGFDKKDLRKYFRDFRHFNFQCALPDCIHNDEPGCKVRDAVGEGDILNDRYDTYLKILESLT
ncbi:MAG: ribosome small subunit-dependent GTPase A, partial [Bacteroidetes bacterium]|nr:ribosome small subunit-dependent GTPase A [Bacteroidota bacterium]